MAKSGKSNGARIGEETKAVYAKLEAELGRAPIYKEVAKALGIGDSAASMRLATLRKRGELPRVGVRSHVANGTKAANGHQAQPRAPRPPRPKASRTSSSSSAPAAPEGLEDVVEQLRARRSRAAAEVERLDRALAALEEV